MIWLRFIRIASDLTLFDVAQKSGVSQTKLSMVERGIVPPTPEERMAIARALGADSDALFQGVSPEVMCKAESVA